MEAGKVLKTFEQDVIRKAKTEGYDGQESNDTGTAQWDFPGALLYSVTVITTIGEKYIILNIEFYQKQRFSLTV